MCRVSVAFDPCDLGYTQFMFMLTELVWAPGCSQRGGLDYEVLMGPWRLTYGWLGSMRQSDDMLQWCKHSSALPAVSTESSRDTKACVWYHQGHIVTLVLYVQRRGLTQPMDPAAGGICIFPCTRIQRTHLAFIVNTIIILLFCWWAIVFGVFEGTRGQKSM